MQGERGALWLGLIALVFSLPALRLPFEMDDHWLRANHALHWSPLELMGGIEPSTVAARKADGSVSWWTNDALRVHFLRPLSSISHYLDFELWGDRPLPMHALNVLIYALLVVVAARLYRALAGAFGGEGQAVGVAWTFAALMFAIDDAHAPSVGWISGRNTLLAALFAMIALWSYVRARTESSPLDAWLSPIALGMALLSGESGVQGAGYLLAYALVLDQRPVLARVQSLTPHALVLGLWAAYYATHGYGASGSEWYREPLHEPLSAALGALADMPFWLGSLLVASFATPSLFADELLARVVWILLIVAVFPPLLQTMRRDALARFYGCGAMLCVLPLLLTRPQDRLLMCGSFGAFGVLGCALARSEIFSAFSRVTLRAVFGLNLLLAPLLYLVMLGQAEPLERSSRALVPFLEPRVATSEVVALNLPIEILLQYARAQRLAAGEPLLERMRLLYAGGSALSVVRPDVRTLEISAASGFLASPFERMFTTLDGGRAFHAGQQLQLPGMHIEVLQVTAGVARPQRVRFVFDSALEDPKRSFIQWRGQRPAPWTPPAIGQTLELPALSSLRSLTPRD